jgi:hypothetical protein
MFRTANVATEGAKRFRECATVQINVVFDPEQFACAATVFAQNTRSGALVATGYRIPTNLISAAPGQLRDGPTIMYHL